eukprot:gene2529-2831_t
MTGSRHVVSVPNGSVSADGSSSSNAAAVNATNGILDAGQRSHQHNSRLQDSRMASDATGAGATQPVTPTKSSSPAPSAAAMWPSPRSNSARSLSQSLGRRSLGALSLGDIKVRIGVCAMDKKAHSKPMKEIVSRLVGYGEFDVVFFGDELILNAPISEWPRVDCLMSWYSDGFPLHKAQQYADLTRPFLINDLHMQDALQDRRQVYRILQENGIAVPSHIIVSRDGLPPGADPSGFKEEEDFVELDGVRIDKPFVEKPASGEDHNIHIYYPHSMGGGVKRLFRKVDNKSSCYDPHHPGTVRRDGSFIYEEFLATGGTDVKAGHFFNASAVYTVGPRYAHAEARKSPVVDGRVLRTADGKEMRFPVLLNPAEKEISRTVCLAFSQKVCGFDLLRSEKGRSYVCDVNGWSFVKNSRKYYDDAAGILRSTILSALAPHRLALGPGPELSTLVADLSGADLLEATRTDERSTREELRCVLAVIRHGDRTPKQKLKVRVRQPALLALFHKHADAKGKQAKLKSPNQLQELLDISRSLLQELEHPAPPGLSEEDLESREEQREKLRIVKTVLEQDWLQSHSNLQTSHNTSGPSVVRLMRRAQAEELGKVYRLVMYPRYGSTGGGLLRLHSTYRHDLKIYSSDEGRVQGLLDLEGSSLTPILVSLVAKDAGMLDAFGKGASEDINRAKNILYSAMTWDPETSCSIKFEPSYSRSTTPLLTSPPLSPRSLSRPGSNGGNGSSRTHADLFSVSGKWYSSLSCDPQDWALEPDKPCSGEKLLLMFDRWQKLAKTFFKKGRFDISKVPDIYDSAKYDALHNAHLGLGGVLTQLYEEAKILADAVIPNEYGTDPASKLAIGSKIAAELLDKVDAKPAVGDGLCALLLTQSKAVVVVVVARSTGRMLHRAALTAAAAAGSKGEHAGGDEAEAVERGLLDGDEDFDTEPELMHRLCPMYASDINSPLRHVRTRIYFTSESHMHSLLSEEGRELLASTTELDYLTQLVFRLYENTAVTADHPERFRLEILFTPGTAHDPTKVVPVKGNHTLGPKPRMELHRGDGVNLADFEKQLRPFATKRRAAAGAPGGAGMGTSGGK